MLQDLKFALRQMAKSPGYTAVVVLTLAFGIGVNTQIFGMVSAMFMQPMPVRDADRLTVIVEHSKLINLPHGLSFPDFRDIRAGSKALTGHIAYFFTPVHLSIEGRAPERSWVEAVTPDAFGRLGIATVLGRPLQAGDGEAPPGTPVAVLTHSTWQSRFGGDPAVIGRTVRINARSFTIVGVAQPGFESFSYAVSASMFVPSGTLPLLRPDAEGFFKYRGAVAWRVLASRAPGASVADANSELAVFAQRFARDFPEEHRDSSFQALAEQSARPDPSLSAFMPVFVALFSGLVILVLVIACANVANLMGARALEREREMVVRSAVGASRGRLLRQLLLENLVPAALAGIVGYLMASLGGAAMARLIPSGDVPVRQIRPPGWEVLAFTAGIALAAGLAAGILPALRSSRADLNEGLKRGAGPQVGGRHRMRNLLVVGQVAASCVVLIASALFLRGLQAAGNLKVGFRPEHLVMLSLDLGLQGYDTERGLRFQKQLVESVRALPGVEGAAFVQHVPFSNNIQIRQVWPDNPSASVTDGHMAVSLSSVTPGFAGTMGVTLLRGRDLDERDAAKAPPVAVINEAMAKAFWPGRDPIGQHFRLDWAGAPRIEVVGLVPTGKYVMLTEDPKPYFYTPFAQNYGMPATLVVRTANDSQGLAAVLRGAVRRLDPDLPVYSVLTMDDHLAQSFFALMPLRMGAALAGVQGAIGLLLAVLGLYSVVSFGVTSRTREIGVRIALGASRRNVLRFVAGEGMRLTLAGMVIGVVFAVGLSFVLSHVVFGVRTLDMVAFPLVIALLSATAAVACWLPARRATRVDPMAALRAE
jgi:putative ABC transport system permease protein